MKHIIVIASIIATVAGCGDDSTNEANPCATRGATYFEHCEIASGNCGAFPDQYVHINSDGTIDQSVSCETINQDGCTAHDTGCVIQLNNECNATVDFTTTFSDDGSSARSSMAIDVVCSYGSCSGSYICSMQRQ